MKIGMINGSPKLGKSNSGTMLKLLETKLNNGNKVMHYSLNKETLTDEQYRELCQMDVLVFAFPLYIDAIPSHLFRMLVTLESYLKAERKQEIYVYAIINNGFYEGQQNHISLDILKNWCERSGLHFGQGIGQGAGEMMGFVEDVPLGHGPLKNLGSAMDSLSDYILARNTGENILFSPNFPRLGWKLVGTNCFWNSLARKNGLKIKDIYQEPGMM